MLFLRGVTCAKAEPADSLRYSFLAACSRDTIPSIRLPPTLTASTRMTALASLLLCVVLPAADAPIEADFVIKGATLYDGSGSPGVVGDMAIKGERIVGVGKFTVAG